MAGVPATIGGMVKMNASAFGINIGDIVDGLWVYSDSLGKVFLDGKSVKFGYRESSIEGCVVLEVLLKAKSMPAVRLLDMISLNVKRRLEKAHLRNTFGSIFKNPVGYSAGFLIEQCGFKGFRLNTVKISDKHANFMVGCGRVELKDALNLMDMVRGEVFKRFGILLEREVKII